MAGVADTVLLDHTLVVVTNKGKYMEQIISKATFDIEATHMFLYLLYFLSSFFVFCIFAKIYIKFTPYNEIALIKSGNLAVSIAFSGALLGYAINLGFVMMYAHNLAQYLIFAIISAIIQLVCYKVVDKLFKGLSSEIQMYGNIPVATLYAAVAVCIGIINGVSGF